MHKLRTLKPIRPNAGLIAIYQKKLRIMVEEMHKSVIYHLAAEFKRSEDKFAHDAAPVAAFTLLFKAMGRMWLKKFSTLAESLSKEMTGKTLSLFDKNLQRQLKAAEFSVDFKMTRNMQTTLNACIQDQVNLITNMPDKYLREIDGLVIRAVSSGRDIFELSNQLQKRYDMTKRRADLIAVDQCNKAHAMIQRQRQKDAGITKAIWMHSGAGRHPRPDHVKANGREYDIDKGCLISGEYIFPGELINCFTGDTPVFLNGGNIFYLWRSLFNGKMVNISVGADLIQGTPNHPILTQRGWVALGNLDDSDQVVCMVKDSIKVVDHEEQHTISTFRDIFESLSGIFGYISRARGSFNFYGDIPNSDVDEISIPNNMLINNRETCISKNIREFSLSKPYCGGFRKSVSTIDEVGASNFSGFSDITGSFGNSHISHTDAHRSGSATLHPFFNQYISNMGSRTSLEPQSFSNGSAAHTGTIHPTNFHNVRLPVDTMAMANTDIPEFFAEFIRTASNNFSSIFKFGPRLYELRSFHNKRIVNHSGHVYTLQSNLGYYSVGNVFVQAKNCRCLSRAVI